MKLSEREHSVLWLLAWGYTNKQIAYRLNLSVKTIETFKARAMEKLEIKTRTQLIRHAVAKGWFKNDPGDEVAVYSR